MAGTAVSTNFSQQQIVDLIDPATRSGVTTNFTVAWGAGNTAPDSAQTSLVSENPETRVAATITHPATDTIQFVGTITATANRTVQEVGVFSAPGANMWLRGIHALLNIETGDRVEYTFSMRVKDSTEV